MTDEKSGVHVTGSSNSDPDPDLVPASDDHDDKQLTFAQSVKPSRSLVSNQSPREYGLRACKSSTRLDTKSPSVGSKSPAAVRPSSEGPPCTRFRLFNHSYSNSIPLNKNPKRDGGRGTRSALVVSAFQNFGGMTTFHGVQYVLAPDTNLWRRFVWMLIISLGFVIVTFQLLVEYQHFTSRPTSINVYKIYTDYTEFPAVTICNDNLFRISAAHEHGLLSVIRKMYDNHLTLEDVFSAGVANLTLDQLSFKAGNRIDNMLLKCKFQGKRCSAQNFSKLMTDYGLCFTFNGPDNHRWLRATSPGTSSGLELVLNIEEYERMAGPNVGSGIHIFVQNKRDYPLVEQKGQAIAAGSHAFISLKFEKETRLGPPYDNCRDWRMEHVSNFTYKYSMETCHVDCYVAFVVGECGCKDAYLPGDAPVCTMAQFVGCLKGARDEYNALKDFVCECYNPCQSESLVPHFSYSGSSKVVKKGLRIGETDRIMERFKRALDINEYYNVENQYKKSRYRNFTQSVNKLGDFYQYVFAKRIGQVYQKLVEVNLQAFYVAAMTDDVLAAQLCVFEEGFVKSRQFYDLNSIKQLADEYALFGISMMYKLSSMPFMGKLRSNLCILLVEDIYRRLEIINGGRDLIYEVAQAFEKGIPFVKNLSKCGDSLILSGVDLNIIIPKDILREAVNRSKEKLLAGDYFRNNLKTLSDVLLLFWNATLQFHSYTLKITDANTLFTNGIYVYSNACTTYLIEHDNFKKDISQWPSGQLKNRRNKIADMNKECARKLDPFAAEVRVEIQRLDELSVYLREYLKIAPALNMYLKYFNVSKFKITEMFNDRSSQEVHGWMEEMKMSISSKADNYLKYGTEIVQCYEAFYSAIFESDEMSRVFEQNGDIFKITKKHRESLLNETLQSINDLRALNGMRALCTEHLALAKDIQLDANQFSNKATIDVTFYSENFLYLNIFFPEISYTITEQQVAYALLDLIGDIGGSMGLLIGGSIVSLVEVLDFLIRLAVSLLKRTP